MKLVVLELTWSCVSLFMTFSGFSSFLADCEDVEELHCWKVLNELVELALYCLSQLLFLWEILVFLISSLSSILEAKEMAFERKVKGYKWRDKSPMAAEDSTDF